MSASSNRWPDSNTSHACGVIQLSPPRSASQPETDSATTLCKHTTSGESSPSPSINQECSGEPFGSLAANAICTVDFVGPRGTFPSNLKVAQGYLQKPIQTRQTDASITRPVIFHGNTGRFISVRERYLSIQFGSNGTSVQHLAVGNRTVWSKIIIRVSEWLL